MSIIYLKKFTQNLSYFILKKYKLHINLYKKFIFCYNHFNSYNYGEMAEWFKAQHWKCCLEVTLTRVRIPLSPNF